MNPNWEIKPLLVNKVKQIAIMRLDDLRGGPTVPRIVDIDALKRPVWFRSFTQRRLSHVWIYAFDFGEYA